MAEAVALATSSVKSAAQSRGKTQLTKPHGSWQTVDRMEYLPVSAWRGNRGEDGVKNPQDLFFFFFLRIDRRIFVPLTLINCKVL